MLKWIYSLLINLIMICNALNAHNNTFPIRITADPGTGQFYINITPSDNHDEQYKVFFISTKKSWKARPFLRCWWQKNPEKESLSTNFRFQERLPLTNTTSIIHPGNIESDTLILLSNADAKSGKYYGNGDQLQECAITLLDYPLSNLYSFLKINKDEVVKFIYFYTFIGCIIMAKDLYKYINSNCFN
ncbi:hypothetical protein J120_03920 [candidate division TM6 bacterium JCVI TM6SC1]|uniref:DUF2271 domain-containing protein n=1 Tax=candidate division TM6 bacterium JCVI TM6SC1 TaxID=1306947 RepID=A0A0D2K462_9BACT|nr:hypothetical protein J120_03920 [candidate division TM6 bacterium JCVI TM6SC1]